jgi:O-antigen ligase
MITNYFIVSVSIVVLAFLFFEAFKSERNWVFILILLMPIRDLKLAALVGGGSLKIGDAFIAFLFGLWIWRGILTKKKTRFIKTKLDLVIILFLVLYAVALIWSTDLNFGLVRVSKFIRNYLLYLIIRDVFIEDFEGNFKKATLAYTVTSIFIALVFFTLVGFQSIRSISWLAQSETIHSTDLLGLRAVQTSGGFLINGPQIWLTLTACFIFGSLVLTKGKSTRAGKLALILIFIFISLVTLNRSVIVLLFVILAVLFWQGRKIKSRRYRKWILVLGVLFLSGAIVFGFVQVFLKRFTGLARDQSMIERKILATAAVDAFLHSPFIGIGPGSNFSWQSQYDLEPSRLSDNMYLTVLSETGLLGFVPLLFMIRYWLIYLFKFLRQKDHAAALNNFVLAILAFSLGYLTIGLVGQEIESLEPWLMMGLASAFRILSLRKGAPAVEPDLRSVSLPVRAMTP